ncbi:hypothetical protein AVEN_148660-1 [Araneus ventricosus]|uniref:Uncharacterized protein n=1 Tax=Araneus ventricosus TaxID=182803 RepID=A0A4Y2TL83_ARAVE|nr:hypothetical protein AVEN_148660-1 [Araneus ventricosus]
MKVEFKLQIHQLKKVLKGVQEEELIICFNMFNVLARLKNTVRLPKWNFFRSNIKKVNDYSQAFVSIFIYQRCPNFVDEMLAVSRASAIIHQRAPKNLTEEAAYMM